MVVSVMANLNQPIFVAASGVGLGVFLRAMEHAAHHNLAFIYIQLWNLATYLLNFYAVQQPGRLDGVQQKSSPQKKILGRFKKRRSKEEDVEAYLAGRRGRTLLAPSGWAFIIWAPIFLLELAMVVVSLFVSETKSPKLAALIRNMSPGFSVAQLYQVLWTASFRPKYMTNLFNRLISGFMLTGTAISLSRAHRFVPSMPFPTYLLWGLPITLHFGWITAATLVNWNGTLSPVIDSARVIACMGFLSVIAAAAVGVYITRHRQAPLYGSVVTWALAACATGMTERLITNSNQGKRLLRDQSAPGIYGAKVQRFLCRLALTVTAGTSAATVVQAM